MFVRAPIQPFTIPAETEPNEEVNDTRNTTFLMRLVGFVDHE